MEQRTETLSSIRRQLLDETRRQGRILAGIIAILDRIESKFDWIEHEFHRASQKPAGFDRTAASWPEPLIDWSTLRPLIRAAIVEALREHDAQA